MPRATFPCPLCREVGRAVTLEAELEPEPPLMIVTDLHGGCAHAAAFGALRETFEEAWTLIEAAGRERVRATFVQLTAPIDQLSLVWNRRSPQQLVAPRRLSSRANPGECCVPETLVRWLDVPAIAASLLAIVGSRRTAFASRENRPPTPAELLDLQTDVINEWSALTTHLQRQVRSWSPPRIGSHRIEGTL